MFSPDEQRKIQAKSLAQWQQDKRAKVLAHDQKLMYLGPDPIYNDPKDLELLKSLRISPA